MASITKTVANAATRFAARLELYNDPNNAEARLKAFPGYGNTTTGLATLISSGRVGGAGGVDFGRVCGNLVDNSIVDICTSFIGQKGVEAPAIAQTWNATSKAWEAAPSHPLQALLDTPNPLFAGTQLFAATYISLCRGNSYFIMVRNNLGNKIAELWWAPHYSGEWHSQAYGMMPWVPPGSQDGLPTCYRYFVRGKGFFIPLEDVVHFRRAKSDPRNPFIGLDPLLAQRSQVATDNEICQYNYSILHNMGIPGAVYSPKEGIVYDINGKAQFKESNKAAITGAKRGDPIILDESYDVTYPNVNPQRMALDTIGNMSEERIPASLGLNAVALQLGAGLDQSHFSTMREAMKWAWDNGISPLHQIIHECASQKIVPAYKATPQQLRIWFPYDNVPCLQEDENLKWTRWISLFEANGVKRSVLLSNLGLELPDGDKDGYVSDLTPPPAPFGGDAKIPVPKLNSAVYMRALPSPQHYKAGATESQVADYIASLPKSAQKYFNANQAANNVARAKVRDAMELAVKQSQGAMIENSHAFNRDDLTRTEWNNAMETDVLQLHGSNAVLGYGGMDNMTDAKWARVEEKAQAQLDYLKDFKADVKAGKYDDSPDGLVARSVLYSNAGRGTYENSRMESAQEDYGHEFAVRVLADCPHCDGCDELAGQVLPIDDMPPIGDADACQCGANCNCVLNTSTVKEDLE